MTLSPHQLVRATLHCLKLMSPFSMLTALQQCELTFIKCISYVKVNKCLQAMQSVHFALCYSHRSSCNATVSNMPMRNNSDLGNFVNNEGGAK